LGKKIAANYLSEDIETLKNDVNYLISLVRKVDKEYGKGDVETYHYIKKVRLIIDLFNDKYPGIHTALRKTSINLFLRIFLKSESTKETFREFFEEQPDLKERIFKNNVKMEMNVEPVMDKTYQYPVEDTLALKKDLHRNMVELIYREDSFSNENSPEFKILSKSALSHYKKNISINKTVDDIFCFDFNDNGDEEDDLVYHQKKTSDEVVY
jgi:hypothetical protein